mmetsp:Transcript_5109/g.11676  ORF Transcript_5109/g.11676 Transcript_5109/m.11676 type:complete len:205 (-) Transcript_5109:84-698(-)
MPSLLTLLASLAGPHADGRNIARVLAGVAPAHRMRQPRQLVQRPVQLRVGRVPAVHIVPRHLGPGKHDFRSSTLAPMFARCAPSHRSACEWPADAYRPKAIKADGRKRIRRRSPAVPYRAHDAVTKGKLAIRQGKQPAPAQQVNVTKWLWLLSPPQAGRRQRLCSLDAHLATAQDTAPFDEKWIIQRLWRGAEPGECDQKLFEK